jgi:hypothetical protein
MKKNTFLIIFLCINSLLLFSNFSVFADDELNLNHWKYYKEIQLTIQGTDPIIMFELDNDVLKNSNLNDLRVVDTHNANEEIEYKLITERKIMDNSVISSNSDSVADEYLGQDYLPNKMFDLDTKTYYQADPTKKSAVIDIEFDKEYYIDSVFFNYKSHNIKEFRIYINIDNEWILYEDGKPLNYIKLPQTPLNKIRLDYIYTNRLEINELKIYTNNYKIITHEETNLLLYYSNPVAKKTDYNLSNLYTSNNIGFAVLKEQKQNPDYSIDLEYEKDLIAGKFNDTDADGIPDHIDNCKDIYNPDQRDSSFNGIGDPCDDYDRDGIINQKDNCMHDYNPNQADSDMDGIGDACDNKDNRWLFTQPIAIYIILLIMIIPLVIIMYKTMNKIEK